MEVALKQLKGKVMADLRNAPGSGETEVDLNNLYREENYTDLKLGSIQKLVPVKADESVDLSRQPRFIGQAQLMTQYGPIPISAPIEATTLEEACKKFPDALEKAMDRLAEEAQRRQVEEASRIVVPGKDLRGGGLTLK